jgi:hypothetical protein
MSDQSSDGLPRQQPEPRDRQTESKSRNAYAGQHQSDQIEAFGVFAFDRIDKF